MTTDKDIAYQVSTTLAELADEHDIGGIVEEIKRTYGLVDIDDIETDEYWAIVKRHNILALLNKYSGDNIFEDVIYGLTGYDDTRTAELDGCGASYVFVAGGVTFECNGYGEWVVTTET